MIKHRLRNPLLTALLICAFLCQETWALAGTTGSLSGMLVESTNGSPIANATIAVTSPSQQTSTTTDASGHFSFISLAPDTYTVSATKDGYQPQSLAGVTIFADNAQVIALKTTKALKNIAIVSARAAGALVKPGTTSDIYSVNAATQETVQSIGGGGNLNSAYSAIVSVPGVQSAIGNEGAGQTIYIRGSQFNEIGYEYDGVPVNRAFDNYNATSLSNLGQQELQVYTGGSPAGASSATVGGFINQVIKTGTYPGFGTIITGIGGPTFYHNLQLEAGGASPNRLFSWYAGLGGYNQEFRFGDNKDFGDVPTDGSSRYGFTGTQGIGNIGLFSNFYTNGPWATCVNGVAPAGALLLENSGATPATKIPGCFNYSSNAYNTLGNIADREGVINLHFGLPHKKDGGRDDVQLLYSGSAYHTQYNDSINDLGGMQVFNNVWTPLNGGVNAGAYCNFSATIGAPILGYPACATSGNSQVAYVDGAIFPTGTTFGQSASTATAIPYLFPNSPTNRTPFTSGIDPRARGAIWNDSQTVKVQYQKNIGSNAYLRVFGYTFYSDWLQNSPTEGALLYTDTLAGGPFSGAVAPDYELSTHTRGVELQFADQLNAKNLLKFTTNYTTASVVRFYNQSWRRGMGASATNLADADGNCYDYTLGSLASCLSGSTAGTYSNPVPGAPPAGSAAVLAGAKFIVTVPGGTGTFNTVRPVFTSAALEDEFKPSDRLDLDLGLRYEKFQYSTADSNTPEYNFWFSAAANTYCYDPGTGQPVLTPLAPGQPAGTNGPVQLPGGGQQCMKKGAPYLAPSGVVALHPNGVGGNLLYSNLGADVINDTVISPRVGLTYTLNPDTVLRASYGKYAEPTSTAYSQYLNQSAKGAAAFDFTHFFGLGFTTPVHTIPAQVSNNFDFSLEKHLKGTDITFRASPFYRYTTNQSQTINLGPNFSSALNVGTQKSYGVEFQAQKGDVQRDGWSALLSYTFTNAKVKYGNEANGSNSIDILNNYITAYNKLTQAGGGSPCYNGGVGTNCSGTTDIKNPYYGNGPQGTLDRNGWYETFPIAAPGDAQDFSTTVLAPSIFSGFIQYKKNKLAIAPNFVLQAGGKYGAPTDIIGIDPRACGANQASDGIVSSTPQNADFQSCSAGQFTGAGSLAIPNPLTGSFDGVAQYRDPWQFNLGAQISYEVTPKVKGTLILANLVNRCFGGDKPAWAQAFPAGNYVCGYAPNGNYIGGGFYNGPSPSDPSNGTAGYPKVYNYPYAPLFSGALPFNAYLNFQIKL